MITVAGKVQRSSLGMGTWTLVAQDGTTYELKDAPKNLLQPGLAVRVTGIVRSDVMTIAMVGPVLEVQQFELLPP